MDSAFLRNLVYLMLHLYVCDRNDFYIKNNAETSHSLISISKIDKRNHDDGKQLPEIYITPSSLNSELVILIPSRF